MMECPLISSRSNSIKSRLFQQFQEYWSTEVLLFRIRIACHTTLIRPTPLPGEVLLIGGQRTVFPIVDQSGEIKLDQGLQPVQRRQREERNVTSDDHQMTPIVCTTVKIISFKTTITTSHPLTRSTLTRIQSILDQSTQQDLVFHCTQLIHTPQWKELMLIPLLTL